jgi:hypothetical protein
LQARKVEVKDQHIRADRQGLADRRGAIGRSAHHREACIGEVAGDCVAPHGVVVGDHDPQRPTQRAIVRSVRTIVPVDLLKIELVRLQVVR